MCSPTLAAADSTQSRNSLTLSMSLANRWWSWAPLFCFFYVREWVQVAPHHHLWLASYSSRWLLQRGKVLRYHPVAHLLVSRTFPFLRLELGLWPLSSRTGGLKYYSCHCNTPLTRANLNQTYPSKNMFPNLSQTFSRPRIHLRYYDGGELETFQNVSIFLQILFKSFLISGTRISATHHTCTNSMQLTHYNLGMSQPTKAENLALTCSFQ